MAKYKDHNIPKFNKVAAALRARGEEVVNPPELPHNDGQEHSWEYFLKHDIAALLDCDAVVLLPGWRNSRGARLERRVAKALGMKITEWSE